MDMFLENSLRSDLEVQLNKIRFNPPPPFGKKKGVRSITKMGLSLQNVDPFDYICNRFTPYICICERNTYNNKLDLEFSFLEWHFYNVILCLLRFRSFVVKS